MAIIRSAQAHSTEHGEQISFDESRVPFVPAWDLLAAQSETLSLDEAASVAAALYLMCPDPSEQLSPWNIFTRLEAVSRRL